MLLFKKMRNKKMSNKFKNNSQIFRAEDRDINQERLKLLTTLEYKVFILLREGFSNRECSQRLKIKKKDFKKHLKSIYYKLDVSSPLEIIIKYHTSD